MQSGGNIKSNWSAMVSLLLGNALITLSVLLFIRPTGIILGGSTGIGLSLSHYFGLDTVWGIAAANGLFLLMGTLAKGKTLFYSSVASSILYPFMLALAERLPLGKPVIQDFFLATVMGAVLMGSGVGLIVRSGGASGGTDNLALAISHWTHLPLAPLLVLCDALVLLPQAFFSSFEQILYGIVFSAMMSLTLNRVMILGQSQLQLFVISEKNQLIRQKLLHELDMGLTMLQVETGMRGTRQEAILAVIHPRALYQVTEMIHAEDPGAFISIVQVKEVRGQGFTSAREQYRPTAQSQGAQTV